MGRVCGAKEQHAPSMVGIRKTEQLKDGGKEYWIVRWGGRWDWTTWGKDRQTDRQTDTYTHHSWVQDSILVLTSSEGSHGFSLIIQL